MLGRRNNVIKVTLSRFEVDATSEVFLSKQTLFLSKA